MAGRRQAARLVGLFSVPRCLIVVNSAVAAVGRFSFMPYPAEPPCSISHAAVCARRVFVRRARRVVRRILRQPIEGLGELERPFHFFVAAAAGCVYEDLDPCPHRNRLTRVPSRFFTMASSLSIP